MKIKGDNLIFSTGKKLYANHGIIGISPKLVISEGYDGGIEEETLTLGERQELLSYMLDRWIRWEALKGGER